jgi:hypothetical protein
MDSEHRYKKVDIVEILGDGYADNYAYEAKTVQEYTEDLKAYHRYLELEIKSDSFEPWFH